jgi:hypothetical protein
MAKVNDTSLSDLKPPKSIAMHLSLQRKSMLLNGFASSYLSKDLELSTFMLSLEFERCFCDTSYRCVASASRAGFSLSAS